jgi:hypothetical protein
MMNRDQYPLLVPVWFKTGTKGWDERPLFH